MARTHDGAGADAARGKGRHGAGIRAAARLVSVARRHTLFTGLLLLAAALRIVAALGFRWQMWFTDSYEYVYTALDLQPYTVRPSGYSLFLRALLPFHSFGLMVAIQHLLGLATGVLVYAVAVRWGARRVVAALVTVPVLFDAYQIQLEHLVLSDTIFMFLITLAAALTLWRSRPGVPAMLVAGFAIGLAAITRSVGLPLLLVFVVFLALRWLRSRRWSGRIPAAILAVVLAGALPMAGYLAWFHSAHGRYAFSGSSGVFLYGRTMAFADCAKMRPPARLRPLCDATPVDARSPSQFYVWSAQSPLRDLGGPVFAPRNNRLAGEFAELAIREQPLDYLHVVVSDSLRAFRWQRTVFPDQETYVQYTFRSNLVPPPSWAVHWLRSYDTDWPTHVVQPYANFLRDYQSRIYLPGTLLGVLLLIGAAGVLVRVRRLGGPALLPWALAAALIVLPAMTADFSYRYLLPAVPFAGLAAALAFAPRDHRPGERASPADTDSADT